MILKTETSKDVYEAKKKLATIIATHMKKKRMTQRQIAHQLGISQSRISHIYSFKLNSFTVDTLIRYCEKLKLKWNIKNS